MKIKVINGEKILVSNLRSGTIFIFARAPQIIYIKSSSGGYYLHED